MPPFLELAKRVFQLYCEEKYDDGLKLLERDGAAFPDSVFDVYYWRILLACNMGAREEAIRFFREAVDKGLWYPREMLLPGRESAIQTADLSLLHGDPEFERLVECCRMRHKAAQERTVPQAVFAAAGRSPASLLIALHGNLGSANEFLPNWESARAMGWNVLLPQSSQIAGPNRYVWNALDRAVVEIRTHFAQACKDHRIGEQTVVAGFSRGAGTAIWVALEGSVASRGFIAVSPSLGPTPDDLTRVTEYLGSKRVVGLRGYFIVGVKDKKAQHLSAHLYDVMQAHGIACEGETHDLHHEFPPRFDESLARALAFITS